MNIIIFMRIISGNYPVVYYDTISEMLDTQRLSIGNKFIKAIKLFTLSNSNVKLA